MAFRKKAAHILAHNPDILVIPECEHPENLQFEEGIQKPNNIVWFGKNRHKGLAVLSYNNFKLKVLNDHTEDFRMVIPILVWRGKFKLTLFAVWANNPGDPDGPYVEQVWKAINYYETLLTGRRTILAGDFNSNTIWDKEHKTGSHSNVVKFLEKKKIFSSYHLHHKQTQGEEEHPTLYMYRHKNKPYHLDYCFVSKEFAKKIQSVEVGEHEHWSKYSDHVPLIVTLAE